MLHRSKEVALRQLGVDTYFEEIAHVLALVLVNELALLGLDVALFASIELAALLNNLLRKILRIAPQPLNTLGHHEHLLDRVALLPVLALLEQSQRVLQTGAVLVDGDVAVERQHYEEDNPRILRRNGTLLLKTPILIKYLALAARPVKGVRILRLPVEDHDGDGRLVHRD